MQTKPIPATAPDGQGLGGKGVMVNSTFERRRQNKANSGGAGAVGLLYKQTQFFDCGLPERHRATGIRLRRSCRVADWAQTCNGTRFAGQAPKPGASCTNKPNLLEPNLRNKANWPSRRAAWGSIVQTKPIPAIGPRCGGRSLPAGVAGIRWQRLPSKRQPADGSSEEPLPPG